MMLRKSLMIIMVFVSGMILLTQSTWASEPEITAKPFKDAHGIPSAGPPVPCDVDSLTGSWTVLLRSVDELGEECWAGCTMEIGSGGMINKGKYYDCNGKQSPILGGYLTMSPGCTVKGKIETPKENLYAIPGGQIVGDRLVLGLTSKAPVNEFEQGEMEALLHHHSEDIQGVLLRIQREKEEKKKKEQGI
jgi:hypothetical protein